MMLQNCKITNVIYYSYCCSSFIYNKVGRLENFYLEKITRSYVQLNHFKMLTNFIRISFLFNAVFTGTIGLLLHYVEPYLPISIIRTYRYGKFSSNSYQSIVAKVEVPKGWFKHFYIFGAPTSIYILYLVFCKYLLNSDVPEIVIRILNMLLGTNRQPLVSPENTFLATVLLCMHCCKRFYETQCISVFSNRMMNIAHYIVGFHHYVGTLSCLIGESKGFVEGSEGNFSWQRITYFQLTCAVVLIFSSYTQLKANYILSSLRKDKTGKIESSAYKIPYGSLFNYVSGALQTTEIMIYVTTSLILWQASTFHYITIWVIINQVSTAVLTHQWYIRTFKNYPESRKILIPYLF